MNFLKNQKQYIALKKYGKILNFIKKCIDNCGIGDIMET